ncbi:MAG: MarR family transcriptional regulator [Deltaproteobacteria bacterium]|jgi:MarR family transcriptional regulator, organic hydroperoxide resistance regulator|nr:MarR family transcriptional regulator [Deltaproteobacteria bacterium]MBT4642314.1 MarR family transcriptional regulator [Deltaproteobacteria bacterium]MBT6503258.1 MarR family transcriptional regulator [Deltaproteobacteria bacterium]MBT7889367.1 MarR family transcriptional regulator [Deltaproteobacteria bacterium]
MNPKDCIFFHLAKANQAGSKVWRSYMSRLNLTAVQGMVLNFLKDRDYITSKDLGERTLLDSATLTGILDRLEKQALVVRQAHPSDRRAVIICLTDAGRDLTQQTDQEAVAANQDFLQSLDRDEQAQLKTLLTKLREKSA